MGHDTKDTSHLVIVTDPAEYLKSHPHVVIKDFYMPSLKPGAMVCERCGEVFSYNTPCRIEMAAGVAEVFTKIHGRCGEEEDE